MAVEAYVPSDKDESLAANSLFNRALREAQIPQVDRVNETADYNAESEESEEQTGVDDGEFDASDGPALDDTKHGNKENKQVIATSNLIFANHPDYRPIHH
jgi:hypothetical protein